MNSMLPFKSFGVLAVAWSVLTMSLLPTSTALSADSPHSKTSTVRYYPGTHSRYLVPQSVFRLWERVAWCETHENWSFAGSRYDGGLGIMPGNWIAYGGLRYGAFPHLATPYAQVLIATRIQHGLPVPDAVGCEPW